MQAELDTMRKRLARRGNRRVVASVIKLRKTSKRANRIERIRHVKRKRSTSKRVG